MQRESDPADVIRGHIGYTTTDIARMLGVPVHTVRRWCEKGYIGHDHPDGTGTKRRLSEGHLLRAREIRDAINRAVRELDRAGLPKIADTIRLNRSIHAYTTAAKP